MNAGQLALAAVYVAAILGLAYVGAVGVKGGYDLREKCIEMRGSWEWGDCVFQDAGK